MKLKRTIGAVTAVVALTAAGVLYAAHPAKSSDHQDTYNLATRSNTSADITDVFVFPAQNPNNVVFAMNVSPLIPPGMGPTKFFDPTLMYQFKISHSSSGVEDQVIQLGVSGTGSNQTITMYGPGAPNEVGTTNTFLKTATGSTTYNQTTTSLQNGTISLFAGPRTDVFFFDLFGFFTFAGDRNYGTHTSQSDPGPETATNPEGLCNGNTASNVSGITPKNNLPPPNPNAGCNTPPKIASFNGFAGGTMSNTPVAGETAPSNPALGNYACDTTPAGFPAADSLFAGPFNVLTLVVEVPKSLITGPFNGTSTIHVWATVNSSTGS